VGSALFEFIVLEKKEMSSELNKEDRPILNENNIPRVFSDGRHPSSLKTPKLSGGLCIECIHQRKEKR